ncbi:hypothetical protein C5167_000875 [Papaver somniferum]|uniref:Uncharacterized protein n=1 Tax=Papaver somniferum TaxID=3469 RepID=A0A4Y7KX32_PAPSO|nr:uncharacterized protein LOC113311821 [Papaver somniferum]RZC76738.1 hypothetical protein C5167_000875 [Papaver somniferum]
MGEIIPNLEDGELWLPSDILPDESFSNKFHSNFSTHHQLNEFMEEEEEPTYSLPHLSTYSLFQQNHVVPSMNLDPHHSKQIKLQNQFYSMGGPQPAMGLGIYGETPVGGHYLNFSDNGGGCSCYESTPPFRFHDRKLPPLPIAGDILQARSTMLQKQHKQQQRYPPQNHYVGRGNNGSWNRGNRGTGVFIPRTPPNCTVANPGKKKQSYWKGDRESVDAGKRLQGQVKRSNPPTY